MLRPGIIGMRGSMHANEYTPPPPASTHTTCNALSTNAVNRTLPLRGKFLHALPAYSLTPFPTIPERSPDPEISAVMMRASVRKRGPDPRVVEIEHKDRSNPKNPTQGDTQTRLWVASLLPAGHATQNPPAVQGNSGPPPGHQAQNPQRCKRAPGPPPGRVVQNNQ